MARTSLDLCCVEMIKSDDQLPPDCPVALWALTASITMPLISGMEKMRSTREKNSTSPSTFTSGDTLSTAAPRVIRRCGAFPLFVILLPVAKALVLVLPPCELLFGFGFLGFKFFEFRTWLIHADNLLLQ